MTYFVLTSGALCIVEQSIARFSLLKSLNNFNILFKSFHLLVHSPLIIVCGARSLTVMACGFALLEAGVVGAKNVVSTCVRNLVDHNSAPFELSAYN